MSKELHGAIITLDFNLLLEMLDFKGGHIHRISTDIGLPYCKVLIEHPDLPQLELNAEASIICPSYTKYFGEDGGLIRVERKDPPKRSVPPILNPVTGKMIWKK